MNVVDGAATSLVTESWNLLIEWFRGLATLREMVGLDGGGHGWSLMATLTCVH